MNHRVFISYGREDLETARRLYQDLADAGLVPWMDDADLMPGQNWRATITRTIRESGSVLALLSSRSLSKRGYVQKELKTALDVLDEFPPDEIFLIPVRVDECTSLDPRLSALHWVDLFPAYEDGLAKILWALRTARRIEGEGGPPEGSTPVPRPTTSSIRADAARGVVQAGTTGTPGQSFQGPHGPEDIGEPGRISERASAGGRGVDKPGPEGTVTLLHLSDLHFGTDGDAVNWFNQLAEDLAGGLDVDRLDGLILSGDIATRSEPDEYAAARRFLEAVFAEFDLDPSRLVMVPGNHDLNWRLARKGYDLVDLADVDEEPDEARIIRVGEDVLRVRNEAAYRNRFAEFSRFHETVKGIAYPLDYPEQAVLHHLPACNLLILGFNSAWNLDHHFRSRAAIHPEAVGTALGAIRGERARFEGCLKLAVFHHPLISPFEDRITDHGFMERLAGAGFRLALHGHIHKAEKGQYAYDVTADGRSIHTIGAGTFGAPVKEWTPGHPLQYNLLRFTRGRLTVETRCRRELHGAWGPDAIWTRGKGKDPLPRYVIDLGDWSPEPVSPGAEPEPSGLESGEPESAGTDGVAAVRPAPADPVPKAAIDAYVGKVRSLHEYLPVVGFKTRLRAPIRIADVYVPLRAMVDLRATGDACFADSEDAEKRLGECGAGIEISVPDAFREADRLGRRGVVILGDPGSGKTTHLRRLMLWCLEGGWADLGLPVDTLPVFLPLRELRDLGRGLDAFIQAQLDHPHLGTPDGFGKRLLDRGDLLLLFDGLDEVAEPGQRVQVSRWIDEAMRVHGSCRFVVTSRFAGYTAEARLGEAFLEMHMRPLSADQAEIFIHNWYRSVETGLSSDTDQAAVIAREKADDLLARLRGTQFRARRVFAMTRNPLLLANLCLVHRDRGYLPRSRARLYEECIEVLLELWRGAIGFPSKVTARTGRRVLQPVALWLHEREGRTRATAGELAPVMEPALRAVGWEHGAAESFLSAVRDESGLLTGWDQDSYGFMHLGFQEYLAAREIRRTYFEDRRVIRDLAARFGEPWWQEVILLLLALQEEPSLMVPFMRELVKRPAFADHRDLVELCLDEATEISSEPFIKLLEIHPGEDLEMWERQNVALHILERIDRAAVDRLMPKLLKHTSETIRRWVEARRDQQSQEMFRSESVGYEMVLIPGGTFTMGSPPSEAGRFDWEGPAHPVRVAPFYLGRYPVTNEEYGRFLAAHPAMEEPRSWSDRSFNQPKQPVVGVSWHDARRFAEWAGLALPSEAQWEYACRAGTSTRYNTGDAEEDLDRAAWYRKNSGDQLRPVGGKAPNEWGLYDMHGNVWEWVEDDWHGNYEGAPEDGGPWVRQPRGPDRVLRGGSWIFGAEYCRTTFRRQGSPEVRSDDFGFRLARRADEAVREE